MLFRPLKLSVVLMYLLTHYSLSVQSLNLCSIVKLSFYWNIDKRPDKCLSASVQWPKSNSVSASDRVCRAMCGPRPPLFTRHTVSFETLEHVGFRLFLVSQSNLLNTFTSRLLILRLSFVATFWRDTLVIWHCYLASAAATHLNETDV